MGCSGGRYCGVQRWLIVKGADQKFFGVLIDFDSQPAPID
jgi:hypothetical protein